MMIVGARLQAAADSALSAGWHSAAFARTKTMKQLDQYLRPKGRGAGETGADKVRRLFARKMNAGGKSNGV